MKSALLGMLVLAFFFGCKEKALPPETPEALQTPPINTRQDTRVAELAPIDAAIVPEPLRCESDNDCVVYTICCDCPPNPQIMNVKTKRFYEDSCSRRACGGCDLAPTAIAPEAVQCLAGRCKAKD